MWETIFKHHKLLIVWGVIGAVSAVGISLFFPIKYSATSQILIITRAREGVDPYTQAKSAERIGENLAVALKTSDFYGKVAANTNVNFDREYWKQMSERDRRKQWNKDVRAEVIYGTSLLAVQVYAPAQKEALALGAAVADTISSRGWEYVGGDVAIKIMDYPLVSRFPSSPNLAANAVFGTALGAVIAAFWVLKTKKRHNLF